MNFLYINQRFILTYSLILCPIFFHSFAKEAYNEEELYAGMDYAYIFDQTSIMCQKKFSEIIQAEGHTEHLTQIAYPVPSSADLDNALVQEFRRRKRSAMQRNLRQPAFEACLDIAVFGGGPRLINLGENNAGLSNLWMIDILGWSIKKMLRALYTMYISPIADPLHTYEEQYAKKKRFFPQSLQECVESKFGAARHDSGSVESVLAFSRIALNMPTQSVIPYTQFFSYTLSPLEEFIKQQIGYCILHESIREDILNAIIHHITRVTPSIAPPTTPKNILYFEGPPGTGKTHMAQTIARALGVTCIEIHLTSDDARTLVGDSKKPGQLIESLAHARNNASVDAVILIDEIDRILNNDNQNILATLLPLLEPMAAYFHSPYLNANIDIGRYFIILAGNSPLKYEALRSRISTIKFPALSKEQKYHIVFEKLLPQLCTHTKTEFNIDPNNISAAHKELIVQCIENDIDPGIRSLQLKIAQLITHIRRGIPLL